MAFDLTRLGLEHAIYRTQGEHEPTIYRTQGEHANYYTTDAVFQISKR